jgi:hypothetical protein
VRGRIRRTAGRALAMAVAGWVLAMTGSVLVAPSASADPAVTVAIRDLTPPVVSVDAGGTVTFVNEIQDKTVQVGGGGLLPTLVSVTAHTDVTLKVPSGSRPLPAGARVGEKFASTCVGCTITYTYRLQSNAALTAALTDATLKLLPPLPAPTPFVVNTLVPLPNLPSVNLPQLPPATVPAPPSPAPGGPPVPAPPADPVPQPPADGAPADDGGAQTVNGTPYSYGTAGGAAQLAPTSSSVSALANSFIPGQAMGRRDASGSGGVVGDYDGASVPVFGQLAGLDSAVSGADGTEVSPDAAGTTAGAGLTVSALAAFLALAGVSSALVRGVRLQRASR